MPTTEPLVIEAGRTAARLRLELAGGEVIYLDIRVKPGEGVEVAVPPPTVASLVAEEPAEQRAAYYGTPEFRQRLIEHVSQAKDKAIADSEAARHGRS
jgi:hypothetical protein